MKEFRQAADSGRVIDLARGKAADFGKHRVQGDGVPVSMRFPLVEAQTGCWPTRGCSRA